MTRPDWKAQAIANQLPEGAATILRDPASADVENPLVRHLRKLDVFALDASLCLVEPLQLSPFGHRVLLYLNNSPHAVQDDRPTWGPVEGVTLEPLLPGKTR